MNTRKIKKAIKRLLHLPKGKYFWMYATNKARHFYYKLTKSAKVAYPATVMIELSSHCNLHCTTCPREYDYGKSMFKGYMPIENAKKIIDELWPYLDSIGLTGMGETLLYKDLEEVVDYIKSKNSGIIISLSTNAMIPDFIEKVRPLIGKVDTIQVSIDGMGEVYESIRLNAHFATLDNNIRSLTQIFAETDTVFMLNMVVTIENYMQMADIVTYAAYMGIQYVNFTLFNLAAVTNESVRYYDFYHTSPFIEAFKKLDLKKIETKSVKVTHWDFSSKNEFRKCLLPWTHFPICSDGYIPPCCAKPFPKELNFGNVFENGVMPILNSKSFLDFRQLWYKNRTPLFCEKCHYVELKPIDYSGL